MGQRRPWRREQIPQPPAHVDAPADLEMSYPKPGKCKPGICGEEAACKHYPNDTYMCICPHDSSSPTIDLECPNRLTVPLTPRPIHNIIPPTGRNTTTPAPNVTSTTPMIETANIINQDSDIMTITLGSSAFILLLMFFISVICWRKRGLPCKEKTARKVEPPLTGEPLLAERYITNPQYSSGYGEVNNSERRISVRLINIECVKLIEKVGEGCFGKVYKGELADSGFITIVAVKMLKENANRTTEDDFNREVTIMNNFKHKNILSLLGVVENGNQAPWMVFEYMPFGDLVGVLRSNAPTIGNPIPGLPQLEQQELLHIAFQIAEGMKYLSTQRFVHRDLACRNCLVGDNLTVKIADFGMSRDVYTSDYYKMGISRPMPVKWMSPESIMYAKFTLESDVWSYGVVLWEIFSLGKQPFYDHSNESARNMILHGIMLMPPEKCLPSVWEVMRACWKQDPKSRIKFAEICEKLEYVKNYISPEGSGDSRRSDKEIWTRSLGSIRVDSSKGLPRPPATLPNILLSPSIHILPTPEQLMDPEGYLVPAIPTQISEYITAIPD